MARQSATQHLAVLEAANLISTVRRGREKLHYLNPVPLHEIQERWIDAFERPRLRALSALKRKAEHAMTDRPSYVYVTYIEASPEAVWHALTDADDTAAYWGHANVSDWKVGSRWEHQRTRRLRRRRRRGPCGGGRAAQAPRHHLGGHRRGAARPAVPRHLRHRAVRGDRAPHRHPRRPARRGGSSGPPPAGPRCAPTSSRSSRPASPSRRSRGRCTARSGPRTTSADRLM